MIAVALVLTACATTSPHALSVSLCPNGDEPTKSVSADGSYYVWACADSGSSNGLLPDTLKQIKVVKDWEPITNIKYSGMQSITVLIELPSQSHLQNI